MELGLIGLPKSGKTTIFNALTRAHAEISAYAGPKAGPNLAIVEVADDRVTRLAELYQPKKTVLATVTFIDFAGLEAGAGQAGIASDASMGRIKTANALAYVVRNFNDDLHGEPTCLNDIERLDEELLISDLIITEKRLERIEASMKKGLGSNPLKLEEKVLRRVHEQLGNGLPIRALELSGDEEVAIRGFQFLTDKPVLVILNSDESSFGRHQDLLARIERRHRALEFAGAFEMELSRLADDEAKEFMDDMGIPESARARLTRLAHEVVGYISFFTVGQDEVRAWNIRRGSTALEAAATVHTDMARGFIRAECFTYDELMECGSEKTVKEKGRFRLEGKQYVVQDGDILSIRFSV
ncbi:MAG: DUF933 domain-containing protein [Acidobacteriota bacterium]